MRGRTNAGNGGIFLNATTDTFEVASGNITAGDFIEYYYDETVKSISGTSIYDKAFLVDASQNLYVTVNSGYVTLFTYANNVITTVASYNNTTVTQLFKYTDTKYISSDGKVFAINTTNRTITLEATLTLSINGIFNGYLVKVTKNSSGYTIVTYSYSGGSATQVDTKTFTDGNAPYETLKGVCVFNYGIAYAVRGYDTSTSTKHGYGLVEIVDLSSTGYIGDKTEVILYNVSHSTTSMVSGNIDFMSDTALNGVFLPVRHYNTNGTTTTQNYYYKLIAVMNQNAIVNIHTAHAGNMPVISESYLGTGYLYFFTSDYQNNVIELHKVDMNTLAESKLDTVSQDARSVFHFTGNDWAFLTVDSSNIDYQNVVISGDIIVQGELTNTVKEWTGNINPLGVAKQSGSAGDTIEVYIPQVNV